MGLAPIYKECFLIGKRETEKCALCQDLKDMVRIFHLTPLAQSSRNLWCLELSSTNFCWSQAFTSFTNSVRESLKKTELPFLLWMWKAMIYFDECYFIPQKSNESQVFRCVPIFVPRTYSWKILVASLIPIVGQQPGFLMWITSLTGMPLDATDPPASQWGACSLSQPTMI